MFPLRLGKGDFSPFETDFRNHTAEVRKVIETFDRIHNFTGIKSETGKILQKGR